MDADLYVKICYQNVARKILKQVQQDKCKRLDGMSNTNKLY